MTTRNKQTNKQKHILNGTKLAAMHVVVWINFSNVVGILI
jgi:hypothetical protein